LEKQFGGLNVEEKDKDDSEIDIKVEELLQDLTIHDKDDADRKGSFDIKTSPQNNEETNTVIDIDKSKKLLGKRDRKGDNIEK